MLAVILESSEPERLYTGLSLLVSAAAEGEEARALLTFGALPAVLDPELEAHALTQATHVAEAERDAFARTLAELRATALEQCRVWACSAAMQAHGLRTVPDQLEGVTSMPRFVRDVDAARLVLV